MPSDLFDLMLGKALTDPKFRKQLVNSDTMAAALKEIGIENPTKAQLQAVQNAITALTTLSNSFGDGFGAA
jgi:predicted ABC-type ATPase